MFEQISILNTLHQVKKRSKKLNKMESFYQVSRNISQNQEVRLNLARL